MIWYPYEQMKTMRTPYKITDAEGVYLYTEDQKLIDSVSSWWCMIHGCKHPELTAAIKEQADRFCHVMLGGCTCVEVYDSKTLEGFQQFAHERGVFSRPFLKYMYSMVPYVIKEEERVKIFDTMKAWFK